MFTNQNFTIKEQQVKVCSFKKYVSRKELEELIAFLNIKNEVTKIFKNRRSYLWNYNYFLRVFKKDKDYKIHLVEINTKRVVCEDDYLVKFSNNQIKTFSKEEFNLLFENKSNSIDNIINDIFKYNEEDCSEEYLSKLVEFLTEGKKKEFEPSRPNVMEDNHFIIVLHKDEIFFSDRKWIEVNLKYDGYILPVLDGDYIVKQGNKFVVKTEIEE